MGLNKEKELGKSLYETYGHDTINYDNFLNKTKHKHKKKYNEPINDNKELCLNESKQSTTKKKEKHERKDRLEECAEISSISDIGNKCKKHKKKRHKEHQPDNTSVLEEAIDIKIEGKSLHETYGYDNIHKTKHKRKKKHDEIINDSEGLYLTESNQTKIKKKKMHERKNRIEECTEISSISDLGNKMKKHKKKRHKNSLENICLSEEVTEIKNKGISCNESSGCDSNLLSDKQKRKMKHRNDKIDLQYSNGLFTLDDNEQTFIGTPDESTPKNKKHKKLKHIQDRNDSVCKIENNFETEFIDSTPKSKKKKKHRKSPSQDYNTLLEEDYVIDKNKGVSCNESSGFDSKLLSDKQKRKMKKRNEEIDSQCSDALLNNLLDDIEQKFNGTAEDSTPKNKKHKKLKHTEDSNESVCIIENNLENEFIDSTPKSQKKKKHKKSPSKDCYNTSLEEDYAIDKNEGNKHTSLNTNFESKNMLHVEQRKKKVKKDKSLEEVVSGESLVNFINNKVKKFKTEETKLPTTERKKHKKRKYLESLEATCNAENETSITSHEKKKHKRKIQDICTSTPFSKENHSKDVEHIKSITKNNLELPKNRNNETQSTNANFKEHPKSVSGNAHEILCGSKEKAMKIEEKYLPISDTQEDIIIESSLPEFLSNNYKMLANPLFNESTVSTPNNEDGYYEHEFQNYSYDIFPNHSQNVVVNSDLSELLVSSMGVSVFSHQGETSSDSENNQYMNDNTRNSDNIESSGDEFLTEDKTAGKKSRNQSKTLNKDKTEVPKSRPLKSIKRRRKSMLNIEQEDVGMDVDINTLDRDDIDAVREALDSSLLNKELRITDDDLYVMSNLNIVIPFVPPELHTIETRMSSVPTKKQQVELKECGMKIKTGPYSDQEDEMIKTNFMEFCKLYHIKPNPLPFFNFRIGKKTIIPKKERVKFVQYLGQGLENRMLYSIYIRFRKIFNTINKGKYSSEEDQIILTYTKSCATPNRFSELATLLKRDRNSVIKRHRTLTSEPLQTWNLKLYRKIIEQLITITGVDSVNGLEEVEVTKEDWKFITDKLKLTVTASIVKQKWDHDIHPRLFNNSPLYKLKKKLINILYDDDVKDEHTINWHHLALDVDDCTGQQLHKLYLDMLHMHVPYSMHNDFGACISYLKNECPFYDDKTPIKQLLYSDGLLSVC